MVVLGLLLLVGAGVFAAAAIMSNTGAVGVDLWGLHISNLSVGGVFVAGLVTGAVALLGLAMLFAGIRRAQRLRRERRVLARENARLAQHVENTDARAESDGWTARHKPVVEPVTEPVDGPVERADEPVHDRAGYQSPPPPSYDRATIESERDDVADRRYEPAATGEPAADEVSRRRS